jgi:hypothetical protein
MVVTNKRWLIILTFKLHEIDNENRRARLFLKNRKRVLKIGMTESQSVEHVKWVKAEMCIDLLI